MRGRCVLQRPDSGDQRLKQGTNGCLDLRAILFNDLFEDRCRDNKDGGREDDPTISFCELVRVVVRVEAPDEEDAGIYFDIVLYICEVMWLSFHKPYEHNGIG